MIKILVLNSGSSSLKFQLFDMQGAESNHFNLLASGLVERIGETNSSASLKFTSSKAHDTVDKLAQKKQLVRESPVADHQQAIETMAAMLKESGCMVSMEELTGIGHRVVHGGEHFHDPVVIDEQVLITIKKLIPLAPLHNPANLTGIRLTQQKAPGIPQVAVFDTSFHQSMPEQAYIYGLPYALYKKQHVRRYGFHGTSHQYVSKQAADYLGKSISELKLITIHLGNGTSAAAIQYGHSIDTSMGMTPLEGLIMGTRCGDIDPAIPFYLARETGMTIQELDDLLNKESGLKGICGQNDMRTIVEQAEQGDNRAELAITIFCYHIKKYIGAYIATLNGADAIIFTGGIGENSSLIRERACQDLQNLGINIDSQKNSLHSKEIMEIQGPTSQVKILVIPTNEELEIAIQTIKLI